MTVTSYYNSVIYVLNIHPFPNLTFSVPFNTSNTTVSLKLHRNVIYNVSVKATNCAGSSNDAHIYLSYYEPTENGKITSVIVCCCFCVCVSGCFYFHQEVELLAVLFVVKII